MVESYCIKTIIKQQLTGARIVFISLRLEVLLSLLLPSFFDTHNRWAINLIPCICIPNILLEKRKYVLVLTFNNVSLENFKNSIVHTYLILQKRSSYLLNSMNSLNDKKNKYSVANILSTQ